MYEMSPQEHAERIRQYHEAMEPWIKQAARLLCYSNAPQMLMAGGDLVERTLSPQEQQIIAWLQEVSRSTMKSLGLSDKGPA